MQGTRIVYTAASIEGAVLEVFVHMEDFFGFLQDSKMLREDYALLALDVPEFVSRERVRVSELPRSWRESPETTREIGARWLARGATCLLEVPSSTLPGVVNYLINPVHPDTELLFPRPPQPWDFNVEPLRPEEEFSPLAARSITQFVSLEKLVDTYGKKELFLCHAEEDSASVAEPLFEAFLSYGVGCWWRGAEIKVGDSFLEKTNEGLRIAEFVVALVSPAFLRSPDRVNELATAIARRNKKQIKKIFPVKVHYPKESVDIESSIPLLADTKTTVWNGDAHAVAGEIIESIKT